MHFYSPRNRKENLPGTSFLPVSKAYTYKSYVYQQCAYIVYIYITTGK